MAVALARFFHDNCAPRRTLPNFVGLLWTLAKVLRVFWAFYRAASYDVTFSLSKGFCLVRHKILSSSRTSGVGGRVVEEFRSCCGRVVEEFRSCCCFLGKLSLKVIEEFGSCLSKPEGSVCHFWTLYVNQDVVCFSLFAIFEPTDPLWSHTKRTKYCWEN